MARLIVPASRSWRDRVRLCVQLARHSTPAAWLSLMNLLLVCICFGLLLGRTAPPVSTLDKVLHAGVLRVGSPLDYAPFALGCPSAAGVAVGSDIEAARALAESLGVAVQLVQSSWPSLLADAMTDRYDIGVGGISPTLDRMRRVGFSSSYAAGGKVAVARCGSPLLERVGRGGLASLAADGAALTVAVNAGGTNERTLRASLPSAVFTLVPTNGLQFSMVLDGAANLTLTDRSEAKLYAARHAGRLCYSSVRLTAGASVKALLLPRRGDVPWQRYVDAWLEGRRRSGELDSAVERWIGMLANTSDLAAACAAAAAYPG